MSADTAALALARGPDAAPADFDDLALEMLRTGWGARRYAVDPEPSSYDWMEKWKPTLRGDPATFVGREHMVEPYQDDHRDLTFMAAAQTGKTVLLLTHLLRGACRYPASMIGGFWPTQDLAEAISVERFGPFLRSSPEFYRLVSRAGVSNATKKERASMKIWRVAGTTLFFLWTGPPGAPARATTESHPFKMITFDEVRRMDQTTIELAEKRTSAYSDYRKMYVSTAGAPGVNIDKYFQAGDQRYFHTACKCADGIVLPLTFPDCIEDLRRASPERRRHVAHLYSHAGLPLYGLHDEALRENFDRVPAVYICPRCDTVLLNPRDGWWEQHNPGTAAHSYQLSAMQGANSPAPRILYGYEVASDRAGIWENVLGLPSMDKDAIFVQPEDLAGCVDEETKWWAREGGPHADKRSVRRVAGIDVQAGYVVVIILTAMGGGITEVAHAAIVHEKTAFGSTYWEAVAEILYRWRVKVCVIDEAPEFSRVAELQEVCKKKSIAVYAAHYAQLGGTAGGGRVTTWGDERDTDPEKGAPLKTDRQVTIDRTRGMEAALDRFRRRLVKIPDPDKLLQELPVNAKGDVVLTRDLAEGTWKPCAIGRLLFKHWQSVAFVREAQTEKERALGIVKVRMEHVNLDPHFSHAFLYATVAAAKLDRGITLDRTP